MARDAVLATKLVLQISFEKSFKSYLFLGLYCLSEVKGAVADLKFGAAVNPLMKPAFGNGDT